MTQKDRELLLRDLCPRLPYNIICQVEFKENGKYNSKVMLLSGIFTDEAYFTTKGGSIYSNEYKPYLFPLSSMTDEQKREFYKFFDEGITESANETRQWLRTKRADETMRPITIAYVMVHKLVIEWLNKNHFNYRGLIEKGLAIDATNLNIYYDRERKGKSL